MDIGAEFEDDFFERAKEKQITHPTNYEIKVCKPSWFMDSKLNYKDKSEALIALKCQADFHYASKDYPKAIELYEHCLNLVPDNNNTWKREFMENLSRSLLHQGNSEKALEWSLKLYEASTSPDQKITSMNLLATVCHSLEKYEEELEALHHCVEAHQSCPEMWHRLGLCYAGLFHIDLPEYSPRKTSLGSEEEPCCSYKSTMNSLRTAESRDSDSCSGPADNLVISSESSMGLKDSAVILEDRSNSVLDEVDRKCQTCTLGTFMVSSCLIRTRTLLDSGGPNLLTMEQDEDVREKINRSLSHMEMEQSFIDVASKSLGMDFLPGMRKPNDTESGASASQNAQEFPS